MSLHAQPIDHAKLANVTATHCCVCRAHLTDAESVEHGIGPICSKRYYNPKHKPTAEMVQDALGALAVSDIPDHIIDAFIKVVDNDHVNARLGCNVLVYWASCNYDNRAEVFKCAAIIRLLGYTELADKLEIDRTAARIESFGNADGSLTAYVGTKYKFEKDMGFVTGAVKDESAKVGSKVKWTIPAAQVDHFICVLGVNYGGELACGDNPDGSALRVWTIARKRWFDLRVFRNPPATPTAPAPNGNGSAAPAFGNICLNLSSAGQLEVKTPYDGAFVAELKSLVPYRDRTWDANLKVWRVKARHFVAVAALVGQYYGTELGV